MARTYVLPTHEGVCVCNSDNLLTRKRVGFIVSVLSGKCQKIRDSMVLGVLGNIKNNTTLNLYSTDTKNCVGV